MNIKLVEAGPKVLPVLPDHLIERTTTSLEARGVEFLLGLPVTNVSVNEISLKDGRTIVQIRLYGRAVSQVIHWLVNQNLQ